MEGADQVLAVGRVDAGLAADRAVDLGEQGGGICTKRMPRRRIAGGEAGEIADDAAAERDDQIAALEAQLRAGAR